MEVVRDMDSKARGVSLEARIAVLGDFGSEALSSAPRDESPVDVHARLSDVGSVTTDRGLHDVSSDAMHGGLISVNSVGLDGVLSGESSGATGGQSRRARQFHL